MFAVFIGLTAMFVLWSAALGLDEDAGTPLAERLGTEGTLNVLILVVVLTVLGPLGEEFLFRGYIFRALRNWRGVWPAAITTGVLFAATHIGWLPLASAVPATLLGVAMCLLYHWTGSLYPCIALHTINNSIALGGVLHWTWQAPLLIAGSTLQRWRSPGSSPADSTTSTSDDTAGASVRNPAARADPERTAAPGRTGPWCGQGQSVLVFIQPEIASLPSEATRVHAPEASRRRIDRRATLNVALGNRRRRADGGHRGAHHDRADPREARTEGRTGERRQPHAPARERRRLAENGLKPRNQAQCARYFARGDTNPSTGPSQRSRGPA